MRGHGGGARGGAGGLIAATCNATDARQIFAYNSSSHQLMHVASGHCVDVHSGGPIVWMYGCSLGPNDRLQLHASDGTVTAAGRCLGVEVADPAGSTFEATVQAWAKPLPEPRGGVALLVINPDAAPADVALPLWVLPKTGAGVNLTTATTIRRRDIWARTDLAPATGGAQTLAIRVGGLDSVFWRLY